MALPAAAAGRRSFLGGLVAAGASAVMALLAVPLSRFSLYPLWANATELPWSDVGPVGDFASAATPVSVVVMVEQRDGWRKVRSRKPVYVVNGGDGRLRVLSSVCPHLGCSITWSEGTQQFLCPCHNGVFAPDGALVSGPPPRAMDELDSVAENGVLRVRYQYFRQLVPTREVVA